MARIAREVEGSRYDDYVCKDVAGEKTTRQMVAHAAADIVRSRKLKVIVVAEDDLELIALVAAHRPEVRIIGFSKNEQRRHQGNLYRAVTLYPEQKNRLSFLKKLGIVKTGDRVLELENDEVDIKEVS